MERVFWGDEDKRSHYEELFQKVEEDY